MACYELFIYMKSSLKDALSITTHSSKLFKILAQVLGLTFYPLPLITNDTVVSEFASKIVSIPF